MEKNLSVEQLSQFILQQANLQNDVITKASRFMACEKIAGDYLEFGVFRGNTFTDSFHAIRNNFMKRIQSARNIGGSDVNSEVLQRETIWQNMRFFAFDSFQGLPQLDNVDEQSSAFKPGMYANSQENFVAALRANKVDLRKVQVVKGWFEETCSEANIEKYGLSKAAIIWIDSDLYSSAKTVLNFIPPLLQDGTILVFDDWFANLGNPQLGEQRAFYEWVGQPAIKDNFIFTHYQKDKWKRNSFIVSRRTEVADQLGLPTVIY